MLGRIKLAIQNKHCRNTPLDFFSIHELRVNPNPWSRGLHCKGHFGTGNGGGVFLHWNKPLGKGIAKEVAHQRFGAHVGERNEVHFLDVQDVGAREANLNDLFFAVTVHITANPGSGQHHHTAVAVSALGGDHSLSWDRCRISSVKGQIILESASLISTSGAVSCMISKFLKINIRKLGFSFMDSHGVIEPHKVLILNGANSRVADKVVLGNLLDTHRGGVSGQLVLGTVDRVGINAVSHHFWAVIHRHFLRHALEVDINLTHVLTLGS